MRAIPISESLLKENFSYEPETGVFSRKTSKHGWRIGRVPHAKESKYIRIWFSGRHYMAHRLAWLYMTGEWPEMDIDHINGDGRDNRFKNLRAVPHAINCKNMALNRRNKHGIVGVGWVEKERFWRVNICDKKQSHIGCYRDFFEACCARKSAEIKLGFHINHGNRKAKEQSK